MQSQAKFNIKRAWVLFWISTFICYRLGQARVWPETLDIGQYWMLEPLLFFASFPASLFYVSVVQNSFCTEYYTLTQEPWLWVGMFIAGYLQWFKIMPLFFARPKLTALHLSAEITQQQQQQTEVAATPANAPAAPASHTPQLSPPTNTHPPLFSHFDDRGQTPLGRCLLNYSQDG